MTEFKESDELIHLLYLRVSEQNSFIKSVNTLWANLASHEEKYDEFSRSLKLIIKAEKNWERLTNNSITSNTAFIKKLVSNTFDNNLTPKNIKMCTYIKMGLTNKEIASILQISVNSVKRSQTRLKEKFDLGNKTTLRKFIYSI